MAGIATNAGMRPHTAPIASHDILGAFEALRGDLGTMQHPAPALQVEFVIANDTELTWRLMGTALHAGEWLEGALPPELISRFEAVGATAETHRGGVGASLGFRHDFHDARAGLLSAFFVVFGASPQATADRVELYAGVMPKAALDGMAHDGDEFVMRIGEKLEDRGGARRAQHTHITLGNLDLVLTATYSGTEPGVVELAVTHAEV
ncbi:hypothetical protein [Alloyangia pacifica]|uniref:hypothetical protein n=1 Tax=Alloyangia pacifica TaxID=311180 RepID=UPI001CFE0D07|nr:hypothetical protein [Alloyangia pacifica]